jgi:hypothetical protein
MRILEVRFKYVGILDFKRPTDVVDDHRRLVTVEIRKLKRSMIDQQQDFLFRPEERIQARFNSRYIPS